MQVGRRTGGVGTRRLLVAGLMLGIAALGIDAAVGHLLSGDTPTRPQWIPIFVAPATFLLLGMALVAPAGRRLERWSLSIAGWSNVVLGLAGTVFHLKSLFSNFRGGEAVSWHSLLKALSVAPPTFAPAGFAAIGLMALLVASPRLVVRWERRTAAAREPAVTRVGSYAAEEG